MLVHHQSMEAKSNEMEVFRIRLDDFQVWEEEKLAQINLDNLAILEKYFYLLDNCNWEYNWQLGQMLLHQTQPVVVSQLPCFQPICGKDRGSQA